MEGLASSRPPSSFDPPFQVLQWRQPILYGKIQSDPIPWKTYAKDREFEGNSSWRSTFTHGSGWSPVQAYVVVECGRRGCGRQLVLAGVGAGSCGLLSPAKSVIPCGVELFDVADGCRALVVAGPICPRLFAFDSLMQHSFLNVLHRFLKNVHRREAFGMQSSLPASEASNVCIPRNRFQPSPSFCPCLVQPIRSMDVFDARDAATRALLLFSLEAIAPFGSTT
uniref:Uncharacterized protein n=1 Tax=Eutreptiella gymnastica TaxID=73025 RepID=A0A7S4D3I5_9EUGL|mmetsp:Transcript_65084/g.108107  ORF Transcript_65084/g.108107 Transcript_65084/m.108107 type:complete len:224 (+) Transcript_65084:31-702(+)